MQEFSQVFQDLLQCFFQLFLLHSAFSCSSTGLKQEFQHSLLCIPVYCLFSVSVSWWSLSRGPILIGVGGLNGNVCVYPQRTKNKE